MSAGWILLDVDGKIVSMSRSAERAARFTLEAARSIEFVTQDLRRLKSPALWSPRRRSARVQVLGVELEPGHHNWIFALVTPIHAPPGGAVALITDSIPT